MRKYAIHDYVQILTEISAKVSVASFMGYLKVKSGLIIYEKHMEEKCRNDNSCVDDIMQIRREKCKKIQKYIQKRQEKDKKAEQLTIENFKKTNLQAAGNKYFMADGGTRHEMCR